MLRRLPAALVALVALVVPSLAALPVPGLGHGRALAQAAAGATPVGDNGVVAFGAAAFAGSAEGAALRAPVVAVAATVSGGGYWLATADGGVLAFGDAPFLGSAAAVPLRRPVVAIAATASGRGYWLASSDGGVYAFGDAPFLGSAAGLALRSPIVALAGAGGGYVLVARDGGVFAFGAPFLGSLAGVGLRSPVVGVAAMPSGAGYWLAAADGGVFAFGDAPFAGSMAGAALNRAVTAITATSSGRGYWLAAADGGVFAFGDAPALGTAAPFVGPGRHAVGISGSPGGHHLAIGRADLALGAIGPGVEGVQRRLLELGYWGPVDGTFGPLTTQQVWAFQKVHGLPRDGTLDGEELALLERAGRPAPRSTTGYVVEIDKARQVMLVARDGVTEWVFNVSTGNNRRYGRGAVAVTPEGRFSFTRQINALRISALGALFRPKYFVGGYAVHGSPSVPPYPASHGCVRVTNAAINFIWDHDVIPLGTPLWVYS